MCGLFDAGGGDVDADLAAMEEQALAELEADLAELEDGVDEFGDQLDNPVINDYDPFGNEIHQEGAHAEQAIGFPDDIEEEAEDDDYLNGLGSDDGGSDAGWEWDPDVLGLDDEDEMQQDMGDLHQNLFELEVLHIPCYACS